MITFLERPAWQLETKQLRVTIMECGGHVAEIVLKSGGDLNPLWIQNRPTIDSDRFDPLLHGELYGRDAEARLISGLVGHNLCFPYWGSPSYYEENAGMTLHGESNIRRWKKLAGSANSLRIGVTLPDASVFFERSVRCDGQIVYFDETAHNLSAWDRPVGWCEHITFGPPFLEAEATCFQASLTRGFRTGQEPGSGFAWPEGRNQIGCDLTGFSASPQSDLVNSFLVDPSREIAYFVAWHPRLLLLIGYIFKRREFPWMNIWECNNKLRQTRGMEFSNTPIDGTMRQLAKTTEIWGVPVYDWLGAKSSLSKRYAAFVASIPMEFCGVEDIRSLSDTPEIVECKTGDTIKLSHEYAEE